MWYFLNIHGDLWLSFLFCGLHVKTLQWNKFDEKNVSSFSVMSHCCDFPLNLCLFFINLRQLSYKNLYGDPKFLKVPCKQSLVYCTSWKIQSEIVCSLYSTKKPGLPLNKHVFFKCNFVFLSCSLELQHFCMKLVQYNQYLVSSVDTDELVF